MASEAYHEYLHSEAWQKKRMQRLSLSRFACAACRSSKGVEVHHLTYERIFNENMEDLLPLCWLHHKAAEELIDKGRIPRTGNVLHLATETIRLVCPQSSQREAPVKAKPVEQNGVHVAPRNQSQSHLLNEPWFRGALRLSRHAFKKLVRDKFAGHRFKGKTLSNAFALYDRNEHSVRTRNGMAKKKSRRQQKREQLAALILNRSADDPTPLSERSA